MTISKLPNGRYRVRIWKDGRDVPATPGVTYPTLKAARDAYSKARLALRNARSDETTVRQWWERWTTQPAYARPKQSTNIARRQATRLFVERYGHLAVGAITRRHVGEWRESGTHDGTIPALRAMWNDAITAGVTDSNPFARLGIRQTRGNRDVDPPSQEMVWRLIRAARPPGFAAWLQVAAFTGMRPGELDALRWDCVENGRIHVAEQFSSVSRPFTLPKNGRRRYAPLTAQAAEALNGVPRESEFCFVNTRREHWTATSRGYWWNQTRTAAGYSGSLYLATRHHAGWFMVNELGLSAAEVAIALGHEDGGRLVENLYGHRDRERTLERVVEAYAGRSNVVPLIRRAEEA